jgi:hypothetical protein
MQQFANALCKLSISDDFRAASNNVKSAIGAITIRWIAQRKNCAGSKKITSVSVHCPSLESVQAGHWRKEQELWRVLFWQVTFYSERASNCISGGKS